MTLCGIMNLKKRHILQQYVEDGNIECIGNLYRNTMRNNQQLRNDLKLYYVIVLKMLKI